MADEDTEDEEEDELHDELGTFGTNEQLEVMCDELHDHLSGFKDDHSFSCACANFGNSCGPTDENRMTALMRDYHSSALGSDDRVGFWNDTGDGRTLTKMMPGAHLLMKFNSGNAKLKRVVSHAVQAFCDERRKNEDMIWGM